MGYFYRKIKKVKQNNLTQAQEIKRLKHQLFEQLAYIKHQNTGLKGSIRQESIEKQSEILEFDADNSAVKEEPIVQNKSEQSEETFLSKEQLEVVTVAETVEENIADNVATENNSISIETPVEAEELPIQELKENVSEASTETTAE
jgi:hypothetical protein